MRKVEKAMCEAIKNRTNLSESNTTVLVVSGCVMHVYLHGNLIAVVNDKMQGQWTFAGWPTKTTKSRLRALGIDYKNGGHDVNAWYDTK